MVMTYFGRPRIRTGSPEMKNSANYTIAMFDVFCTCMNE
jgi:hypothetical protein